MVTCPRCGADNPEHARFCLACGTALNNEAAAARAVREERKVVSVLFADLAGFTAEAEQMDPEEVRAVLQPYHAALRTELERFGGTVEKFIGDAVMALFGAPVAHEDDPERAVRAALAIRDSLVADGRLHVRIGITTGEALVALEARPESGEGMAAGDVVNTAARLQGVAPVDGILVDETTYRGTSRAIDYREHAPVTVKGKAQPIRVREAVSARSRLGVDVRQVGQAPLVGRQRELEALFGAFDRTRSERQPQLVTLVGVPGIGKSRIVWELFQRIERGGELVAWRQGRSLPYAEGVSYWALGEIVKAEAGILETDSAQDAAAKLTRAVDTLVLDASTAESIARHLLPLVGLGADVANPGDRRGEAFAAWRGYFEALADRRPLVLVFEDLHWADDGLLDFVDHLVDWSTGVPLLIVATSRPELLARRAGWGGGRSNALTISLAPLSDAETSRLVATLVEQDVVSSPVHEAVLERAQGNPLYAQEFARLLAERGAVVDLPESVQGVIAARLDSLPRDQKDLLQDAAVVGKVFWSGALTDVSAGASGPEVEERLHELERKQFVRRERRSSVAGETEYAFLHVLVRDVAYGQIPRAQRAEKHLRVAGWIESRGRPEDQAEMLAHHCLSALDLAVAAGTQHAGLAERARNAARQAGDRALSLNAFATAARFYGRAVELLPADDSERPQLLLRLGRSLWIAEARGEQELLDARHGLLELGERDGAAEAEVLLSEIFWTRGDRDRASQHAEAAAALAHQLEPSRAKALVLNSVSRNLLRASDPQRAIEIGTEALTLAERLGLDELRSFALGTVGLARAALDDDSGIDQLQESIDIADSIGSAETIRGHINLAQVVRHRGDLVRSSELLAEALRLADRFGSTPHRRFIRGILPHMRYRHGAWDEAVELADRFLEEVGASHVYVWLALGTRALIRLARDDERGMDDAIASVEAAERSADRDVFCAALEVHARTLVLAGRHGEAAETIQEVFSLIDSLHHRAGFDLPHLVVTVSELGLDGARVLNAVRPGRWADAARLYLAGDYAGAADVYRDIGSPTDEADARLRAARAMLDAGDQASAETQLRQALAFYRSVGASRILREAEAFLPAPT